MKRPALALAAALAITPAASANFHLFDIQEIYSNADGSVQFVELFTTIGGQQFLGGHTFSFDISGVAQSSINLTNLGSDSANKTVLIGTSNLGTLYGVTPDFIIPANFFIKAPANNTVNFASGIDVVNLASLPLNGVQSLNGVIGTTTPTTTTVNAQATPKNFAGQTFTIPEPSTLGLLLGTSLLAGSRRRRQHSGARPV